MTRTPWGNADKLRARRLRPGPGAPRAEVVSNQRERLMAAMVSAVEEHGYEATRVADLVAISGVSRSAFYRYFDDKLDCFLATADEIAAAGSERIAAAFASDGSWDARLRAAVDVFLELVVDQPAAARLCLVEAYAAGPAAVDRLERGTIAVEQAVGRAFDESPERADMPREIVRAIVGGVLKTVHTRLRRGQESELRRLVPELLEWGLGYRTPPQPLRRARRRPDRGDAPHADPLDPRDRFVGAVADTVAARGYPNATIVEIADRASASLSTFYATFDSKEEAFLAAVERAGRDMLATALPAYERAVDWPHAVRDGLDAAFGFLAAEPALASVLAEAYAAGPRAFEHGDRAVKALRSLLEPGSDRASPSGELVSEAIGGGIQSLACSQVRQRRIERMRELTPVASYVALAPFVGATTACAVANEPLRPR
jgi:AcrR family transcriptional regulator